MRSQGKQHKCNMTWHAILARRYVVMRRCYPTWDSESLMEDIVKRLRDIELPRLTDHRKQHICNLVMLYLLIFPKGERT